MTSPSDGTANQVNPPQLSPTLCSTRILDKAMLSEEAGFDWPVIYIGQEQQEQLLDHELGVDLDLGSDLAQVPEPEPESERPFHAKRPHRKSRNGCKSCKARKVKCDEARPKCKSCRLRKTECIYLPLPSDSRSSAARHGQMPSPAASVDEELNTSLSSSPSLLPQEGGSVQGHFPMVVFEPMARPAGVDMLDMKALWFFTATTCKTFTMQVNGKSHMEDAMKGPLVQLAFASGFLMDSILALASQHQRAVQQDYDSARLSLYRARSFAGYRKAVENPKSCDSAALLGNSLLMCALAADHFRDTDMKELYLVDWLIVWRGIGLMIQRMNRAEIRQSGIGPLFSRIRMDLESDRRCIPSQLLAMVAAIAPGDPDYDHIQAYHDGLKCLGDLYLHLPQGVTASMSLRILTWATFLPAPFMALLREKRTRALVILTHYAAFLKLLEYLWWVEGVGERSLLDLRHHLGEAWEPFARAPLAAIGQHDTVALIQIMIEENSWSSQSEALGADGTGNDSLQPSPALIEMRPVSIIAPKFVEVVASVENLALYDSITAEGEVLWTPEQSPESSEIARDRTLTEQQSIGSQTATGFLPASHDICEHEMYRTPDDRRGEESLVATKR